MQYSGFSRIFANVRHLDLDIDNQTLVEECRSGDRDAMSLLYTRFAPRMLHVISRYVNDSDSAQDILHDGFVAAFTHLDNIRDPERLDFWLATIMKNLSLKYLQAQTVTSILDEIPESVEEPELDNIIDFVTLESLIRQLPEGYQKVFRLAVLEGKSHKEISRILGIAPNSSSSQLFHAKLRLRELIKDYQLRDGFISLLLLFVSSGMLFLTLQDDTTHTSEHLSTHSTSKKQASTTGGQSEPYRYNASVKSTSTANTKATYTSISSMPSTTAVVVNASDKDVSEDSLTNESTAQSAFSSDSVGVSTPPSKLDIQPQQPIDDGLEYHHDQLLADLLHKANSDKGWSAGISVDPGILSFNGMLEGELDSNSPWQDPTKPPSGPDDDATDSSAPSRIPRSPQGIENYLGSSSRRHYLPISFALTAEKHFSSRIGLETGMTYSYLHTDFEHPGSVSTCHWHYLEIPLKVNLYAYTTPRMKLYFGFGGRVAIPVYTYAQIAPNPYCQSGRFDSKAVWSLGGSVGASFRLSKRVDLFIEPSLHYHYPQECKVPNIWTDDEPWSISIPIGFRFNW